MNNIDLSNLNSSFLGRNIGLYGSVLSVRPGGKKLTFLTLYDNFYSIQCVCLKGALKEKFDEINSLTQNSKVYLIGTLKALPDDQPLIKSCYYQNFEFLVDSLTIVSIAEPLPFSMEDANIPYNDETERSRVLLPTRLDNRTIDLHTPFNNALFECKSGMLEGFRKVLVCRGFTEIQTPKILGVSSESGSSVFQLSYFGKPAFLAQSPQLYKQMMINSGKPKVFEIGPVFRSENAHTNRHLCEFTGLDIEMRLQPPDFNYHEVINMIWDVLRNMFQNIDEWYSNAVEYIRSIHPFDNPIVPDSPVIITFREGAKLLNENGFQQNETEDLTTENERQLGSIVKSIYGTDLFVLTEYPTSARPFYTKQLEENPLYTKSYDIIFRGVEICSGAQRENNPVQLNKQIADLGLSTAPFEDYLKSFKYGSPPHGGGGLGLERVLILYFDLGNVKLGSLFPRDPSRITP
jgi:aspartyl-tRNA synthetase